MGMRILRVLGSVLDQEDRRLIGHTFTLLTLAGTVVIAMAGILGTAVHVFRITAG